jgi:glucosamine--fructose-6-phosphate aminotransferase (isomerizing)
MNMCGIFGYVGTTGDVGALCFNALKQLEYRGYDSWGIAVSGEELEVRREIGKLPKDAPDFKYGKMVIGHSRWATHGGVSIENAHPHTGNNGQAVIVHNGIVENYLALKEMLGEENGICKSETDTEIIVQLYEFARIENEPLQAFLHTIKLLKGNNAVVIMDLEAGILLATRNGSPIVFGRHSNGYCLASDVAPLLGHCESIYYVENNEILIADAIEVCIYDQTGSGVRSPDWQKPEIDIRQVELGSYPHYLIKEVSEQPAILRQIGMSESEELKQIKRFMDGASDIWFTGCGSAYFAGMLAAYFAANAGRSARVVYAHELPMLLGQMNDSSRVIALSQSGETIDVIDGIEAANARGVRTAALVNVPISSLARIVECVLPIQAGPEICVLSTKAFSAMIGNLYAIYAPEDTYRTDMISGADSMESAIQGDVIAQIDTVSKLLCESRSLFVIGTGQYYPLALEAALKIKEVSYIHAEAFPSGELKHGVIALIEEGTPCLVFAPEGALGDRVRIHASEIRARGGRIISISHEKLSSEDEIIEVKRYGMDYFFAALKAVQLLAYQCALAKNLDPDKPRNLAKSVTVR